MQFASHSARPAVLPDGRPWSSARLLTAAVSALAEVDTGKEPRQPDQRFLEIGLAAAAVQFEPAIEVLDESGLAEASEERALVGRVLLWE